MEQLQKSGENCTTVIMGNYLKNVCRDAENEDSYYFKCAFSNVTYSKFTRWGQDSRGRYAQTLSGVSEICADDVGAYQACGFTERGVADSVLCEGYFCEDGQEEKRFVTCGRSCAANRECASDDPEDTVKECNDKCEMWETCGDESECNGHMYGIHCTWEKGDRLPVNYICDGKEHCTDGADERGCYGSEVNETLQKCPQWTSAVTVPIMENTRCSVFQLSGGSYPYCRDYLDQTNCTDPARVGGSCLVAGFLSTVSKFVVCNTFQENPRLPVQLCDDDFQNNCFSPSGSAACRVHKHKLCDGEYDCPDKSDEYLDICSHMINNSGCDRRFNPGKSVGIPISWIMDNETDCWDGKDEVFKEWDFCGNSEEKTLRVDDGKHACENVLMCPERGGKMLTGTGVSLYVEFDLVCDGINSCGIETQVCQAARDFPSVIKSAVISGAVRDLCTSQDAFKDTLCVNKTFKRLSVDVFGSTQINVRVPAMKVDCTGLFGEYYVYLSCLGLCLNSTCPLEYNPLYHDSCPGQLPDRVYTLSLYPESGSLTNLSPLTFLTKSQSGDYQQEYFQCNNGKCIQYHQMCDLIDDCGDTSDEINCTNHMICEDTLGSTKKHLISLSQRCDGIYDCFDLSDECNGNCGEQILNSWVLKVLCWTMGILAVLFNSFTVALGIMSLKKCRTDSMLTSKALLSLISFGDLLIGVYLVVLSTYDSVVYGEDYCRHQAEWLSGTQCALLGIISTVGSQISVFAMTVLSSIRMMGLMSRSLTAPKSVGKKAVLNSSLWLVGVVLAAVAISVVPLAPFLEDYFVQGMFYDPEYKVFIGFPTKIKHVKVLQAYYNDTTITADTTWRDITEKVANMFSRQYGELPRHAVHFYGNDGLCLFKYFVRSDDARRSRQIAATESEIVDNKGNAVVWLMLALNLVCFLIITVSYILIMQKAKRSSKRTGRSKDPSASSKQQALQNRITIIVATDFLCWVPFIIISAVHNLGLIDATYWYVTFAMIVLPLNSVLNPLIYDNAIKDATLNLLQGKPIFAKEKKKSFASNRETRMETLQSAASFSAKPGKMIADMKENGTKDGADNIYQEAEDAL